MISTTRNDVRRRPRRRLSPRLAAAGLALVLTASACSAGDPDRDGPGDGESAGTPTRTETAEQTTRLATTLEMGRVTGEVSRAQRRQVKARVGAAVDAWIDGAFVTDGYPRTAFPRAFDTFTDRTRSRALADRALMSNTRVGSRLQHVEPIRRRLKVDLLGVGGRAVSATARVEVVLELTRTPQAQLEAGAAVFRQRVTGRLLLDRTGRRSTWKVFAYDVARGPAR